MHCPSFGTRRSILNVDHIELPLPVDEKTARTPTQSPAFRPTPSDRNAPPTISIGFGATDLQSASTNMVNYDVRSGTWCPLAQCAAYRRADIWGSDLHAGDYYEPMNAYNRAAQTQNSCAAPASPDSQKHGSPSGGCAADSEPDADIGMSDVSSPRDHHAAWEQNGAAHTSGTMMEDTNAASSSTAANAFRGGSSSASTASSDGDAEKAKLSLFGGGISGIFGSATATTSSIFGSAQQGSGSSIFGSLFGGAPSAPVSAPAFGAQKRQNAPDTDFFGKRMKF